MKIKKIGVFAYNWKHYKSQMGLINLCVEDMKPFHVFLANPVKLNLYKPVNRTSPKGMFLHESKKICDHYKIPYTVLDHNSERCSSIIKDLDLDLGVILGARILKKEIIDSFNIGVLNMHHGLLPENRGLNTIQWAIIRNEEQGVTSHLIDGKIDQGKMIERKKIKIYNDDTLLDLYLRLQNEDQRIMISSIKKLKKIKSTNELKMLNNTKSYNPPLTKTLEKNVNILFEKYKKEVIKKQTGGF